MRRRLLINGEWYDRVNTSSLYENEFGRLLIANAQYLVPSFKVCPFKVIVESDEGSAKADLAFIDHGYRQWIVVEVELGHHPFYGHVLPQVRKLHLGVYHERHAAYLSRNNPSLDAARLRDMVKGEQPRVLVLANEIDSMWEKELSRIDVSVYTFSLFKSRKEHHIFETDLSIISLPETTLTLCRRDRIIQSWLQVNSPAGLPLAANETMEIIVNGASTWWTRVDTRQGVYLKPEGRCPLQCDVRYELFRTASGDIELRPSP
jgi:hypothetical protein